MITKNETTESSCMFRYREVNEWPEITDSYIYVKSAKHNSYNERWVGCVLGVCYLTHRIPKEELGDVDNESAVQKYGSCLYEVTCWHGGRQSFHLDDIVIISTPKEAKNTYPKWSKLFWERYVGKLRDPEYKFAPDNIIDSVDRIVKYMQNPEFKNSRVGKGINFFYVERTNLKNHREEYENISEELYEFCKNDSRFSEEKFISQEKVFEMYLK